jgi:spore germination protein YaaH
MRGIRILYILVLLICVFTSVTYATPTRTVFGFHPYWITSSCVDNYRWELLSHIACFSVEATSTGGFSNKHSWPTGSLWQKIITEAHSHGVKVILTCTLFSSSSLSTLLSSATYRTNLINNLLDEVKAGNADGVDIDFEGVPGSQKSNLTKFMTDLNNTFKASRSDYHVTICGPSVDWSNAFDYTQLMRNSDGIFIMAYGYYWSGSSYAGPVSIFDYEAGSRWDDLTYGSVKWTINDYLKSSFRDPQKIILGLPYYGYDWPTNSSNVNSSTRGNGTAVTYKNAVVNAKTYGRKWQEDVKNPWYTYNSSGYHQCWYDDEISLGYKYDEVVKNNLQGIGIWALGYDDGRDELWDKIDEYFGQHTGYKYAQASLPAKNPVLNAYPNPFRDKLEYNINISEEGRYSLCLYDISGRLMKTLIEGNMNKGIHRGYLVVKKNELREGVYFLRLEGEVRSTCSLLYVGR